MCRDGLCVAVVSLHSHQFWPYENRGLLDQMRGLKVIFVSCGDADGLVTGSNNLHNHFDRNSVPHLWKVYPCGGHDLGVWIGASILLPG